MATHKEIEQRNRSYILLNNEYKLCHHSEFDYSILSYTTYRLKAGRGDNSSYNECIIMGDTETSKKKPDIVYDNHVCAWTISIRMYDVNIVTLYGNKPSTMVDTFLQIHNAMRGKHTIIYFHNLSYDWVFLRKFMTKEYGNPGRQLNTKSHYPILIEFDNGIILKDSLILAQRSLDRWGSDMNVLHQKAIGKWDYDVVRNQDVEFSKDELEYIEHDTLCGVECINALMTQLDKNITSMPYTATGIPREEVRKRAKKNRGHDRFIRQALKFEQQVKMEMVYHGGYVHANRHLVDFIIYILTKCKDFASSYPYCMLIGRYPCERFTPCPDIDIWRIIRNMEDYAFTFKFCVTRICLKDYNCPYPALQLSKCTKVINGIFDNGRILYADYVEIYLTELDADIIARLYKWKKHNCTEVEYAAKDYLPRWLTDYVYNLFVDKTKLKGGDPVLYNIQKAKLNSVYGMLVQKPIKDNLIEDYETGEYYRENIDMEEKYQKYLDSYGSVLPYQWGVWVTAYAFHNLFDLIDCAGDSFVYSDTDSVYATDWDMDKVNAYNEGCKEKLRKNGYGAVIHNGREYWLGVAEDDGEYTEFKVLGAKRYCGRDAKTGKLKLTCAGVPKKAGAECLNDDINNFTKGFIFPGTKTNKKTHTYLYKDDIYIDEHGNETGDSIDLSPCNYILDKVENIDWEEVFEREEVEIQTYE